MAEACDGVGDLCDNCVDVYNPGQQDADSDGYGDVATTTEACSRPSGYVADATDCDDGAYCNGAEVCNSGRRRASTCVGGCRFRTVVSISYLQTASSRDEALESPLNLRTWTGIIVIGSNIVVAS